MTIQSSKRNGFSRSVFFFVFFLVVNNEDVSKIALKYYIFYVIIFVYF